MKFSYNWLRELTGLKLSAKEMAKLLTIHAFETGVGAKVSRDTILDIEVLPNRAHDAFSHVGIAKEILVIKGKGKLRFKKLPFRENNTPAQNVLAVNIRNSKLCPRYSTRVMTGVKIKPSPRWLQERLKTCGLQSINNIVDATNYVMLETGQPLHAFDAEKIAKNDRGKRQIIIRTAQEGEKIKTIDGQNFKLPKGVLLITDPKRPLAIAGIKGGAGSEITPKTGTIIIESANFDPVGIRQTSQEIGLTTDASARFSAGITPILTTQGLDRAVGLIKALAGGQVQKGIIDAYPKQVTQRHIALNAQEVSDLLGIHINEKELKEILERLGFEVTGYSLKKGLDQVLKSAKSFIAKAKYKYGASTTFDAPRQFDCSSFVRWLYRQIGVNIPRVTIEQIDFSQSIPKTKIQAGDLVFTRGRKPHFSRKHPKGVGHVGLYIGGKQVIHIIEKKGVIKEPLSKFFGKDLRGVCRVLPSGNKFFLVKAPYDRLDIEQEVDLIEEIIRIRGFDTLTAEAPRNLIVSPETNNNLYWANIVKDIMVASGFLETYNYSFVGEKDKNNFLARSDWNALAELENPLSNEFRYLRPSLIINIVKAVTVNKNQTKSFRFFEIGKVWHRNKQKYQERSVLSCVMNTAGSPGTAGQAFYELKGVVDVVFEKLGITDHWYDNWQPNTAGHLTRIWHGPEVAEIKVGKNEHIGVLGRIDQKISSEYDIDFPLYAFEIDFDVLAEVASGELEYRPISKYPAALRDVAVLVPLNAAVDYVQGEIENAGGKLLIDSDLFDVYEGEGLEGGMKSLAFRLVFQSPERTLSDKEINKIMDKIIKRLEGSGWEVRK